MTKTKVLPERKWPAPAGTVGHLRRTNQLAATTDLHAGDTFLPTSNQAIEGELDGLTTVPGGVELLAGFEINTDVVDFYASTGGSLSAVSDLDVIDDEFGGGPVFAVSSGLVTGNSNQNWLKLVRV